MDHVETHDDVTTIPLPVGMRALLLDALDLGYPHGAAQRGLGNASDAAIAWQCQSMLDDYADATSLFAFGSLS
jgi:hypothetical protein